MYGLAFAVVASLIFDQAIPINRLHREIDFHVELITYSGHGGNSTVQRNGALETRFVRLSCPSSDCRLISLLVCYWSLHKPVVLCTSCRVGSREHVPRAANVRHARSPSVNSRDGRESDSAISQDLSTRKRKRNTQQRANVGAGGRAACLYG